MTSRIKTPVSFVRSLILSAIPIQQRQLSSGTAHPGAEENALKQEIGDARYFREGSLRIALASNGQTTILVDYPRQV